MPHIFLLYLFIHSGLKAGLTTGQNTFAGVAPPDRCQDYSC
jgi:hypothetical protein